MKEQKRKMNRAFDHLHIPACLAIEFIDTFSRMEHALKSTKYVIGDEKRVEPAWDKFANAIDAEFKELEGSKLTEAKKFLLSYPPRKQVLKNQKIQFEDQEIDSNQKTTQQLLLIIRTVRNNLFHGGKYLPDGEVESGRNECLVEASLLVLRACIRLDENVRQSYEQ